MSEFFAQNLGNIIVGAAVLAAVVLAARKVYRQKKSGTCSCGCDNCASAGKCKH